MGWAMTSSFAYQMSTQNRTRKRIGLYFIHPGTWATENAGYVWTAGPNAQDVCVFTKKKTFRVDGDSMGSL